GPERADGGGHRPPDRQIIRRELAGGQSAARGRRGRRPGYRLQRADRGRCLRAGGASPAGRAPHRHFRPRRPRPPDRPRPPARRLLLGDAPDFHVAPLAYRGTEANVLYFVLGAIAGLAGILYNRTLLGALAVADRLGRWPVELRAGVVGAAVGMLAWFAPGL